jgi:hypothetical protein
MKVMQVNQLIQVMQFLQVMLVMQVIQVIQVMKLMDSCMLLKSSKYTCLEGQTGYRSYWTHRAYKSSSHDSWIHIIH